MDLPDKAGRGLRNHSGALGSGAIARQRILRRVLPGGATWGKASAMRTWLNGRARASHARCCRFDPGRPLDVSAQWSKGKASACKADLCRFESGLRLECPRSSMDEQRSSKPRSCGFESRRGCHGDRHHHSASPHRDVDVLLARCSGVPREGYRKSIEKGSSAEDARPGGLITPELRLPP